MPNGTNGEHYCQTWEQLRAWIPDGYNPWGVEAQWQCNGIGSMVSWRESKKKKKLCRTISRYCANQVGDLAWALALLAAFSYWIWCFKKGAARLRLCANFYYLCREPPASSLDNIFFCLRLGCQQATLTSTTLVVLQMCSLLFLRKFYTNRLFSPWCRIVKSKGKDWGVRAEKRG